jgi:hypothetical protein
MYERSEYAEDRAEHHLKEIEGTDQMSLVGHLISQPSLDISPICTPIIAAEIRKVQLRPV